MTVNRIQLGELCTFLNGGTPNKAKPEYYGGEIPWITGADISEGRILGSRTMITEMGLRSSATNLARPGALLLVTRTSVGKVAEVTAPIAFSQDITAVIPDVNRLDLKYLRQFLTASGPRLQRLARGATIKGVTRGNVEGLQIPFPPLPEQRRIAAILDHTDTLRAKRTESVRALTGLEEAVFLDTFGRLNDSWPTVSVADIAAPEKGTIRTGPFGSQLLHEEFVDEGIAVLGIDNAVQNRFAWGKPRFITESKYEQLKRYTVSPGDVLITIMGTNGRCAVVPDDIPTAINTKHLCCITANRAKIEPDFLHAYFLHHPSARDYLHRTAKGAIMAGLNMGIIKGLPINLPPIDRQRRYVSELREVRRSQEYAKSSVSDLDCLFSCLQSRAFRGEL